MGMDLACSCKKCGYRFEAAVGVGWLYPKVYVKTVAEMKEGKFGEQGKEFFEAFPNGAITCENIVVQCNDCGQLMTVPELALYVPKEGYDPAKQERKVPWLSGFSGKGYDYVPFSETSENYQLFERYDHRCIYCNGHTSVVPGFTENMAEGIDRHVQCPECGSMMKIYITACWD